MLRADGVARPVAAGFLIAAAVVLAAAILAGCSSADNDGPSVDAKPVKNASGNKAVAEDGPTAREVLRRMAETYQQAKTYADKGVARVSYKLNGESAGEQFPLQLQFARPNRLHLAAYEGRIVGDGKRTFATHAAIPGYYTANASPDPLTVARAYGGQFLWSTMNEREVGGPLQLELLLNKRFVDMLLSNLAEEPARLTDEELDGGRFRRIQLSTPQGMMVFWIGQQDYVLRRVEYPTKQIAQALAQNGKVSELEVVADFVDARLNGPVAEDPFQFTPPTGAKEVKQFVGPSPGQTLGKTPAEFEFVTLEGEKLAPESLAGKVVVIDFWATWCEFCKQKFPSVNKVVEKYKDNPKVRFLAVSIDQPDVGDDSVKSKHADWNVQAPAARDPEMYAFRSFKIPGVPSMVILDEQGRLQDISVGLAPPGVDPVELLSGKIDKLLAGESLFDKTLADFEKSMMEPPPEPAEGEEISGTPPEAQVAEKSEPGTIKLTRLWKCADAHAPSNLLPVRPGDETQAVKIYAVDGYRWVLEIGEDGKAERRDLNLPQDAAVAFLRTAADKQGKRYFAAAAVGQPRVYVYDEAWNQMLAYPSQANGQTAVGDVQLADFDGDGQVEMAVSFLKGLGVQLVSLDGRQQFKHALDDVISLAVTPPVDGQRKLLCVHAPGKITELTHDGKPGEAISIGQHFLRLLIADAVEDGSARLLGMGYVPPSAADGPMKDIAVGVSSDWQEQWTYKLPAGQQVWLEHVAAATLTGQDRHWIVASADGSLHFLSADGKPLDHFNHGTAITGFAATTIDGKPALLISSQKGLEAWRVEAK